MTCMERGMERRMKHRMERRMDYRMERRMEHRMERPMFEPWLWYPLLLLLIVYCSVITVFSTEISFI